MYEDALGNPPPYCDHRPPKIGTIRTEGKVRVQCLACVTVGPERESPGEAFRALLEIPYRTNRGDIHRNCAMGRAPAARASAGIWSSL